MKKLITTLIVALASLPSLAQYAGNAGITTAAPHFITRGLVAWWKMNEWTTGATVIDYSGNGNNGSPSNFPTYTSSVPQVNFPDPYALTFNGTTQYVSVANNSSLSSTSQLSISVWVNETASKANATVVDKELYLNGTSNSGYFLRIYSLTPLFYIDNNTQYGVSASSPITAGIWHHLVGTYDGSTFNLYVDGVLSNSNSIGSHPISTNTGILAIGRTAQIVSYLFNGSIDDVRIYNRALSANEVYRISKGKG